MLGRLLDRIPAASLAAILRRLFVLAYGAEIRGLENWPAKGERVLVAANHVSLLDAALLAVFLPDRLTFAINTKVAGWWWLKPFLKVVDTLPIDPINPMAIRAMTRLVEQGRSMAILPEGRITVTGALMKVYDGPGMIADKAGALVVPVRIDGAQYTHFSYLKGKLRRRLFPKITLSVLPPVRLVVPDSLRGRARRRAAGERMYDVLSNMMFATSAIGRTIPEAVLDTMAVHGGNHPAVEDIERKPLPLRRLVLGALVLGGKLESRSATRGETIGVLLPNVAGSLVTMLALQMFGRVPAMLNFTAGQANLTAACRTARVNLVLTSRRFVEAARLEPVIAALIREVRVVYLEDIRRDIGVWDKVVGLARFPFARSLHAKRSGGADGPAIVLFTSGSEGPPKGVVLSHRNILANCAQVAARIDFTPLDIAFNALPLFHAFGLTGATLLPLLAGVKVFLYPSPLHYRMVPEMVYDSDATIMFGTDTFLAGYGRVAHPYDFRSVRYVVAGAEKVKDSTRTQWMDKFGLRLLEGYGATETAPVLAVNTPIHYRRGTVGRLLPGIVWRLETVEGIEDGGRLVVSGPNVMLGYLKAEKPGEIQKPPDGWYDTGDVVMVDGDGFVIIQGRVKRFAKVAGEMVSLGSVEEAAEALWPGHTHALVALPDPRRGEQLVLVTTHSGAERSQLAQWMRERGMAELAVPRSIVIRETLPKLGTGKVDYLSLARDITPP